MAGELELHKILLNDKWPGKSNPNLGVPAGGWDSTLYSCCQTVPTYPPGTKIQAYNDHTYCEGGYTMCYMCFHECSNYEFDIVAVSENNAMCSDVGGECVESLALLAGSYGGVVDYTGSLWWLVTNSFADSDASATGRVAVGCCGMSEGEFGWFWVGGVCPVADVTFFDLQAGGVGSVMLGEGNIAMGSILMPGNDGTGGIVLVPGACGTWEYTPAGLALDADA